MRDEGSERACLDKGELFAATFGAPAGDPVVERAKRLCRACPLAAPCLREHQDERDGVWAATTGRERRTLQRRAQERRAS